MISNSSALSEPNFRISKNKKSQQIGVQTKFFPSVRRFETFICPLLRLRSRHLPWRCARLLLRSLSRAVFSALPYARRYCLVFAWSKRALDSAFAAAKFARSTSCCAFAESIISLNGWKFFNIFTLSFFVVTTLYHPFVLRVFDLCLENV